VTIATLAASPEPVPATNQAGEVETARHYLGKHTLGFVLTNDERQEIARIMASFAATQPTTGQESDARAIIQNLLKAIPLYWAMSETDKSAVRAARSFVATQPATSQEGDDGEPNHSHESLGDMVANKLGVSGGGVDYWRIRAAVVRAIESALAPPHAMSQEDYNLRETMAAMVLEHDAGGISLRTMGEARRHLSTLAATPTPPTLSEDLREVLDEARRQLEYLDGRWPTGTTPAIIARIDATLAQVKAS